MTIAICGPCGQRNRMPAVLPDGKMAVCGRCKARLDDADIDETVCDCCGEAFDPDDSDASDQDAYCSSDCEAGELA